MFWDFRVFLGFGFCRNFSGLSRIVPDFAGFSRIVPEFRDFFSVDVSEMTDLPNGFPNFICFRLFLDFFSGFLSEFSRFTNFFRILPDSPNYSQKFVDFFQTFAYFLGFRGSFAGFCRIWPDFPYRCSGLEVLIFWDFHVISAIQWLDPAMKFIPWFVDPSWPRDTHGVFPRHPILGQWLNNDLSPHQWSTAYIASPLVLLGGRVKTVFA